MAELVGVGYRPVSAALQLQSMAHLSRWLAELGAERLSLAEVAERSAQLEAEPDHVLTQLLSR